MKESPKKDVAEKAEKRTPIGRPAIKKKTAFFSSGTKVLIGIILIIGVLAIIDLVDSGDDGKIKTVRSDRVSFDTSRLSIVNGPDGIETQEYEVDEATRGYGKISYEQVDEGTEVDYDVKDASGNVVHTGSFPLQLDKASQVFGLPALDKGEYTVTFYQRGEVFDSLKYKVTSSN